MDDATYYLLLVLLVFFTSGLAFLLLPLMLIGGSLVTYLTLVFLGVAFGIFVSVFIKDLERLTKHHHAGIWAVILFGSVINFLMVYVHSSSARETISEAGYYVADPVFSGIIFSLGFMLPYFLLLKKIKGNRQ